MWATFGMSCTSPASGLVGNLRDFHLMYILGHLQVLSAGFISICEQFTTCSCNVQTFQTNLRICQAVSDMANFQSCGPLGHASGQTSFYLLGLSWQCVLQLISPPSKQEGHVQLEKTWYTKKNGVRKALFRSINKAMRCSTLCWRSSKRSNGGKKNGRKTRNKKVRKRSHKEEK